MSIYSVKMKKMEFIMVFWQTTDICFELTIMAVPITENDFILSDFDNPFPKKKN